MKVIVVGAGVIGASIAYSLSRRGAVVTVIDGGLPAASDASFGWINASFYHDIAHHNLRRASMAAYEGLLRDLPDLPISACGALWWEDQGEGLSKMHRDLDALSYPVEKLSGPQAAEMEPSLASMPQEVLRFPRESAAEVAAVARALLTASGAQVVRGVRVTEILANDEICGVKTEIGKIDADRVVIAAGNGAPEILSSVGVALPMLKRPGVLVTTKPIAAKLNHILVTTNGEVRQLPDGRLLASAVANHQGDASEDVVETPQGIAARVLGWLDPMIVGEALEWDSVSLGYRPVPQDGLPVIGAVGPLGLHVAVMHSGVTLAAIAGQVTADEVMGYGVDEDLLAPYRPQRFQ